jgi:ABC-type lipoprotein export system ATPase subunit
MGKTILMVTHDWHAVESASHVTHLEKGELVPGREREGN